MADTTADKSHGNGKQSEIADGASAMAERLKADMSDGLAKTQEALETVASQTSDELRKVGDQGVRFVRENPALSVAGAVGVGVLIGLALRGRG